MTSGIGTLHVYVDDAPTSKAARQPNEVVQSPAWEEMDQGFGGRRLTLDEAREEFLKQQSTLEAELSKLRTQLHRLAASQQHDYLCVQVFSSPLSL